MIPVRLQPRVARVLSVLRTALTRDDGSVLQLGLLAAIRNLLPGSRVRFGDAKIVRPTDGYDSAEEYPCTVVPRRGEELQLLIRMQHSDTAGYLGTVSRIDESAFVISARGHTVETWVKNVERSLKRLLST